MHYFDILIFALIAVFLALRLRSVLGSRTGEEKPPTDPFSPRQGENDGGKVVRFPGQSAPAEAREVEFEEVAKPQPEEKPAIDFTPYGAAALGLEAIHKADPGFEPAGFIAGAKAAFEMIVGAYAKGDVRSLKSLLAPDVYKNFAGAIEARSKAGQTLISQLIGLSNVTIDAARLSGTEAHVTLRFVSEQVNALNDKSGAVIDGDPTKSEKVVDLWTFMRDVRSKDPNWFLVETLTPE
ncbi:MAG: Tim44/TimA family putative adaptor protein [Rhodospirillales bacterium]|nr:Tim44/TimA family putative adaptor protein [Rhodospirillales bacterium]